PDCGQNDERARIAESVVRDARTELQAANVRRIRQSEGVAPAMKAIEPDLTDRIADALPADIRADFYREMRHCRSLPENDEMLRILRIMQFLTLLMEQVPARIRVERERLEPLIAMAAESVQ